MTFSTRISAVLSIVLFLVLAGAGTAYAYWSTQASISSTVQVANLADSCTNVTSVVNASFEEPVVNSLTQISDTLVPGWTSTPDHNIEIWVHNGHENVPAPVGRQFVELNAHVAGTLSQAINTTPGQTLQWSLLHRGRMGVDTMEVLIGAENGTLVSQGNISDGQTWNRYSGAYVVPAGQTRTQLSFRAVSTATGNQSIGNFLDDVSFGSGPCLTATSTTPVLNTSNPGGDYRAGDTVELRTAVANVGSSLSQDSVYSVVLPANIEYVAGSVRFNNVVATTASYDLATRTLTARLGAGATTTAGGSIAQGTSVSVSLQAVIQPAAAGTTIGYLPTVTYVNGLAPTWPRSVQPANVTFAVTAGADLGVVVAATPASPLANGSTGYEWTFTATNNGPLPAAASNIRITLPASISAWTVNRTLTGTAGATQECTYVSATVRDCALGTLAAGQSRTILVRAAVNTNVTYNTAISVVALATTTTTDLNSANNTATNTAYAGDAIAPTVPGTPTASGTTASQTVLTWAASTDTGGSGVASYQVFRGGVAIATVPAPTTTFTDTGLLPGVTYSYQVRATDVAGNVSALSGTRTVVTVFDASYYTFSNPTSGYCIAALANSAGADLVSATCAPTSALQRWRFNAVTGNYYNILLQSNLGWDLQSRSTANTDRVELWNTLTSQWQHWQPIVHNDAGVITYSFQNRMSLKCAELASTTALGSLVNQNTCSATIPAQRFVLTKVG